MRPTYGVGIYRFVFENDDPIEEQNIIADFNTQIATYEPNITITEVEFVRQSEPNYSGIVIMMISFTVGNSPTTYTFSVNLNGSQVEITV